MTFVKALDELKLGNVIYNKRYPNICYQYKKRSETIYKFRKSLNKWYYDEDDSFGFQEVLFDDWDILNTDGLKFIF